MSESALHQDSLFPHLHEPSEPPSETYPSAFLERKVDPPRLNKVVISGLKGFDNSTIRLAPITLLTGPNNSGKSTVLQAIALGYECLRRCTDPDKWTLYGSGRSVTEFEFLPVNEPKDLWFEKVWKPRRDQERYVRVSLYFGNGFAFSARLRFLFGNINLGVDVIDGTADQNTLEPLLASPAVVVPSTPGPSAHEDYYPLAQVHRFLNTREPNRIIRNVLLRLAQEDASGYDFVSKVLERYFRINLKNMSFVEARDLEVRTPLQGIQDDFSLDIISAGSGLNQILTLAAILAWRRPGLVLLDEPDAHLHASVQAQLLDFLTDLSTRFGIQIVAATHSRDIISRAPLQAIVPVDRTRREVGPLKSIEHLLAEYERQGVVDNVDLALLYQTRRCLFVEGATDKDLLPRIAERLGLHTFIGSDQVVLFSIDGVGKTRLVPELVRLFEKLVGSRLRWGVLRDSDANLPLVKERLRQEADELGFPFFHMWERYSIENYFLEPEILQQALQRAELQLSSAEIGQLVERAADSLQSDVDSMYVTKAQLAYRDVLQIDGDWNNAGAREATKYIRSLDSLERKMAAYPGRRLFGKFVQILQEEHSTHVRLDEVVASITPELCPKEVIECLSGLESI